MLRLYYRRSRRQSIKQQQPARQSSIDMRRSTKLNESLLPVEKHQEELKKGKRRAQYLRLGSVDNPKNRNTRLSIR